MEKSRAILTGPIIGKVTDSTARILVEFNYTGEITCVLTSPQGEKIKVTSKFRSRKPVVFVFKGLKAKTRYTVSFDPLLDHIPSSFKTLTKGLTAANFRVAVVSCNDLAVLESKTEESNLWNDLYQKVTNQEIDYILHIGDSVYMDSGNIDDDKPYNCCKKILLVTQKSQWETKAPELREIIQSEYRRTWGHPSVARVLANVPNLTMFDDHEIRDGWGYKAEDYDLTSADNFYGWIAREVYYLYHRQLRENVNFNNMSSIKEEYYYEILNGVGIVFTDYRGIRTWHRDPNDLGTSQLGKAQWKFLEELFKKTGKFAELNSVLFVSTFPLVWLSEAPSKTSTLRRNQNEPKDFWGHSYLKEQADLLTILREWKFLKEGRELVIICGDIHTGGHTDIYYGKQKVLQQLTASAINNTVLPKWEEKISKMTMNNKIDLGNGYTIEHHGWTKNCNYGLVKVAIKGGKIDVRCNLVESDVEGHIAELEEVEYNS